MAVMAKLNIKMPEDCAHCLFHHYFTGMSVCDMTDNMGHVELGEKFADCPLIEVEVEDD